MKDKGRSHLLVRWAKGDRSALDLLTPVVYGELRKIAEGYLRRECGGNTLQPTALVYSIYLRGAGLYGRSDRVTTVAHSRLIERPAAPEA